MSTECCKNEPSKECCKSETSSQCCKSKCCLENLGQIYGSMLLRLWLAVRAIQTGVEKYSGIGMTDQAVKVDGVPNEQGLTAATSFKEYAMTHYHGVPQGLYDKFKAEPMMNLKVMNIDLTSWMLPMYDKVLGPALIVLGLLIFLGVCYRTSLFLLGLLYVSLTFGLILLKQDDGVSWLGIHMILIVMALMLAKYNRLSTLKKW